MDNLSEAGFDEACASFQPWLQKSPDELAKQAIIHGLLRKKAGATFGSDCYVSPVSRVLTQRLTLGDRSWIAGGAIVRGYVDIGSDCSVNPYTHIAGNVKIGNNCKSRLWRPSMVSIMELAASTYPSKTSVWLAVESDCTRTCGSAQTRSFWTAWNLDHIVSLQQDQSSPQASHPIKLLAETLRKSSATEERVFKPNPQSQTSAYAV